MKRLLYYHSCMLCGILLLAACGPSSRMSEQPVLTVTIEPLRYFAEAIAGDSFRVVSMVPEGNSPETYDPTPQQLVALARSSAYLRIGFIGFERTWLKKLQENAPDLPFYDLSEGVQLMEEEGIHHDGNEAEGTRETAVHHEPGVDPHIWNSVENAAVIAKNIFRALSELDSDRQPYYRHRLDSLLQVIDATRKTIEACMPQADKAFLIYHPALTYFARDYGLTQISMEADGKEPSPAHLQQLIRLCREKKARVIFVQKEFDASHAEIIANELQVKVVPINPLSYHWNEEMTGIAHALCNP